MKKLIELYRQYGISPGRLRDLALEMEKVGRAQKRRDTPISWQEGIGKEIWYLEEEAVLEYLAGQHRSSSDSKKKNETRQQIEDLTIEIENLQAREQALQQQLQILQHNEQIVKQKLIQVQQYATGWKSYAKILCRYLRQIDPHYTIALHNYINSNPQVLVNTTTPNHSNPSCQAFLAVPIQPLNLPNPITTTTNLQPMATDILVLTKQEAEIDLDILAWKKQYQQIKDSLIWCGLLIKNIVSAIFANLYLLYCWSKEFKQHPRESIQQATVCIKNIFCQMFWNIATIITWITIQLFHIMLWLCHPVYLVIARIAQFFIKFIKAIHNNVLQPTKQTKDTNNE